MTGKNRLTKGKGGNDKIIKQGRKERKEREKANGREAGKRKVKGRARNL